MRGLGGYIHTVVCRRYGFDRGKENEMKSMMGRLEKYLGRKNLELNTEKTKIMRFRKGGGRLEKRDWRWKGRKIKEVKEYTYLGYVL